MEVGRPRELALKITTRIGDRTSDVVVERHNGTLLVLIDGTARSVDARKLEADFYTILMEDRSYEVSVEARGAQYHVRHGAAERIVELSDPSRGGRDELRSTATGPQDVVSVMPGRVARVLVSVGDRVEAGAGLVVVEAMKMENEITAPRAGRVAAVHVEAGRTVEAGAALVLIES
jgi:biotin carboxyl carrier protein